MTNTETVRVKLTTEQLAAYADTMSIKALAIEALREKKKRDAAATQADIDNLLDELNAIAKVVQEGEEEKAQRELFVNVDQATAAAALAELAKRACSEPDALSCPVHGQCTCEQNLPAPPVLMCDLVPECTAPATCVGQSSDSDSPELSPGCDEHCGHEQTEQMTCRPVTPEDQPKPAEPTTAPDIKAVDCPLHGVDSQHGKAVPEIKEVPPPLPEFETLAGPTPDPAAEPAPIPTAAADVAEMFGPPDEPAEGGGA